MVCKALGLRHCVRLAALALCAATGALALVSASALASSGPPVAGKEVPSDVGSTNGALNALIEPAELATTYRFEYGTSTVYGSRTPEVALAGDGSKAVATGSVEVQGLQPETTYHFRVVAKNADGEARGVDETFRTFPSTTGLPDGRVYEMVTPPENHDADAYDPLLGAGVQGEGEHDSGAEDPFLVSPSGESVTYAGDPTPEGTGAAGGFGANGANQFIASRSSGQWVQHDISPRGHTSTAYEGFSSDFSSSVLVAGGTFLEPAPLLEEAPAKYKVLYARDIAGGLRALLKSKSLVEQPEEDFDRFAGGSENYESLLFEADARLMPEAPEGRDLYQESSAGRLELVNVLPDGTAEPNATFGAPKNGEAETGVKNAADYSHDISADGRRVFWSSAIPEGQPKALYMHESGAATVQIDASQAGGPGGGGRFWTANEEGSKVFFTDDAAAALTTNTVAGSGANLYEYEVESHTLKDLTPAAEAGVVGVFGAGEGEADSYVYFAATGVLAPGAVAGTDLYVWHDGVTKFIAPLNGSESGLAPLYEEGKGDLVTDQGFRTSEVTPSGSTLLFESMRSLTGYENEGRTEVYVYDASLGELSCASCDPSGEVIQPSGLGGFVDPSYSVTESERWMSDDGDQVFFDSGVPLVPEATNGMINVYEWERDDSGTCRTTGGCVSLLSSGKSSDNSYLYGTSASGDDTFFVTRSQLVPEDGNENFNVYDARADAPLRLAAAACSGTGCQGVPLAPPIFATPASVTFEGIGNFPAPTAAVVKPKAKPLTAAQMRGKALAACRKKPKGKRAACEKRTRKLYPTKVKAKKSAKGRM